MKLSRTSLAVPFVVVVAAVTLSTTRASGTATDDPAAPPVARAPLAPALDGGWDMAAEARRRAAHGAEVRASRGRRVTWNLALDDDTAGAPEASSSTSDGAPLLAVDGEPFTAWRGASGERDWTWTLPFRRIVHLGLLRAHFGDSPAHGVPSRYRWDIRAPIDGRCEAWAPWVGIPGGVARDDDGDTFLYGPSDVHAQKQALFTDVDACALRLVVDAVDGGLGPVLRELRLVESAPSLTRAAGVSVSASSLATRGPQATAGGLVDGSYEHVWAGAPGAGPWTVTVRLPETHTVDRIRLLLGADGAMIERANAPGRTFAAAMQPLEYRVLVSPDEDDAHLGELAEGAPPLLDGAPMPVRRRLIRFAPRPVRTLRIEVSRATGPDGASQGSDVAPVIREIGLYDADDLRPVISEPLFLSVDANPAGLLDRLRGGERVHDARVARDASYRLRRVLLGFDLDTAWPVAELRPRDASAGRFHQVIEGDDPLLRRELLEAITPPPVVMLSGSLDWDFALTTAPPTRPRAHWTWDPTAPSSDPDRGMGLLRDAVRARVAPFLGFCGGAQILALLEARTSGDGPSAIDAVLVRNDNHFLRGQLDDERRHERAWWSDYSFTDRARPQVHFVPHDPLFDTGDPGFSREVTAELPISHADMIRPSAFQGALRDFEPVAWSELCAPWVDPSGPEATRPDPRDPTSRCVSIPQAFRSRDRTAYPIVGFQFHPEQRDLMRLAPGSPKEARGDALNAFANAVDLAFDGYLAVYWPGALVDR